MELRRNFPTVRTINQWNNLSSEVDIEVAPLQKQFQGNAAIFITIKMKVLLSLFCISALLSPGASLECEVCFGTGNSCISEKETCELEKDICVIELTETSKGGKNTSTAEKDCYFSENCTSASVLVTFGQGEFLRKSTLCCSGEDCREDSLPWPPINMTANGKYCPACYSESEPCPVKTVKCTGSENYCLDLAGHKYPDIEKHITLKGCTTESICNTLYTGKANLFDTDTINCWPANQVSQLTGCLLFTLVAYLLMKVLL